MEYVIAWSLYVAAGLGCLLVLMRITRKLNRGFRNLLIGLFIVLTFTPWMVISGAFEYYAPAIVVLLMNVLVEESPNGMKAGVPLLFAAFLMLLTLIVVEIFQRRRNPASPPDEVQGNSE